MQAALPLGPPINLNTYGAAAALLVGIAILPGQLAESIPYKSIESVKSITPSEYQTKEYTFDSNSYSEPFKESILGFPEKSAEKFEEKFEEKSAEQAIGAPRLAEIKAPVTDINLRQELIEYALTWIGVPYLWGGESRTGIDCSAFVQKVYAQYGISLPRTSQEQFRQGEGLALANLLPGDLVFFSTNGPGASHVGIYLGDGEFISATKRKVEIQALSEPYWSKAYRGSRRILA